MLSTFIFVLATKATAVPASSVYLHEVKHDGYRLMLFRDGDTVRLRSKSGIDHAIRGSSRPPYRTDTSSS